MREIILVRHAKSYANIGDLSFGREESPLTREAPAGKISGVEQALALNALFKEKFGIAPEAYERFVGVSGYRRPQETALLAGFRDLAVLRLINESIIDEKMTGSEVIRRHAAERWLPAEVTERSRRFIELVRSGELDYDIYFTHGMFIASVLSDLSVEAEQTEVAFPHDFIHGRGFVPALAVATVVKV
jgi:broad specificity phosphatase PhoE